MISRSESAAATRSALVTAAGELLDDGGPDAVTLRAVGARAGVTRGAPYGHFGDKSELLTAVATESWNQIADRITDLRDAPTPDARGKLRLAVLALLAVARRHPHRYALLFLTPERDPEAVVRAASRSQDVFLEIVADVVGADRARPTGALLLATAHGIAGLETAGHLGTAKWAVTGDELIEQLLSTLGA